MIGNEKVRIYLERLSDLIDRLVVTPRVIESFPSSILANAESGSSSCPRLA